MERIGVSPGTGATTARTGCGGYVVTVQVTAEVPVLVLALQMTVTSSAGVPVRRRALRAG